MAGTNKREVVEDLVELVQQNLPTYMGLDEHKDAVLLANISWESFSEESNYFIRQNWCCFLSDTHFFFPIVVEQAAEFGHFPLKLLLIVLAPLLKLTQQQSCPWNCYLENFGGEFYH